MPSVPDIARVSGDAPQRMGARAAVLVLALLWPAQIMTVAGVMTSMSQAAIAQHFQTVHIAWFILIYSIVGTVLTPFAAKLGDIHGKKKVMLVIIAIGLAGDVIVALAPNFQVLLIGRGLAACYAPIVALVFATVREVFPPRLVGPVSGTIGSSVGFVVALCPLIAGALLDAVGFRGALWFLAGITAVGLALVWLFVPTTPGRPKRGQLDWAGGLLIGASVAGLAYVIERAGEWGWTSLRTLGSVAAIAVAVILFVRVERRAVDPLVDVHMLGRRSVATVLSSGSIVLGTIFAATTMVIVITLYPSIPGVSDGLGWSGTKSGLVAIPGGVLMFATGIVTGFVTRRISPKLPFIGGASLIIAGMVVQGLFHHGALQIILTGGVTALGAGMVMSCVPVMIMAAVSQEEQAMANGMATLLQGVFTAMSAQIMFTALNASGTVMDGTQFYTDASYRNGYFALAGCVAVGLVVALAIPRLKASREVDTGTSELREEPVVRGAL